ncbi:hypothetical protein [Lysobacter sp. TAB13]|uniref:hypothetical protein n=1 Tax=Lysobacter sp. TAB13 TaxID=3233065 RepID=UPI003F99804D
MIRLSKRSVAAMSAFVFGFALISTASYAADPCEGCWKAYSGCLRVGGTTCKAQLDRCLHRYSCG